MSRATARALVLVVAGAALVLPAHPAGAAASPPARRMLIVALPNVGWSDIRKAAVPNLRALFATSGVADLSVPGVAYKPTLADAYATISAGARAQSRPGDGRCTDGGPPGRAITCPDLARVVRHNDDLLYDAKIGALGDTLAHAGYARAVIAGSPGPVALALVDRKGVVPEGTLDAPSSVDAFDRVWRDHSVVLVEAPATSTAGLKRFDGELGAMLERVDPARDAVLVVGPMQRSLRLGVASLRAPGFRPGLMRSAFTRHSGIVGIVDVAPTVLDTLGIKLPDHTEGRAFAYGRTGGDLDARVHWLVATNDRAEFRDAAIGQVGGVFAACGFTLTGVAFLAFALRRVRPGRPLAILLELGALALLFFLPATYLAVLVPFAEWRLPMYWLFLVVVSVGAAGVVYAVSNRRGLTPLLVALSAIVGLIALDQLTGAHLQFNAAFGYSPTIGGRYAGLGNLGFAQLAAAAVLLAGLLAHRVRGRTGVWLAVGVLALALLVDGAPFFGADVGGELSLLPACGVTAAMLFGWRFRWRLVALLTVAAVAVLGVLAAIDLARPAEDRSHLGRLLAGNSDLGVVLQRKLAANLAVVTSTPVTWILPLVYVGAAYLVYRSPGPIGVVRARIPELTASLAGLAVVAVLGTLLNDSGIEITAIMFNVLVPVLVVLCVRAGGEERGAPDVPSARAMSPAP